MKKSRTPNKWTSFINGDSTSSLCTQEGILAGSEIGSPLAFAEHEKPCFCGNADFTFCSFFALFLVKSDFSTLQKIAIFWTEVALARK